MRHKRQQEFASFGKILKGLLQRKGMSQTQLAEVLGVQRQAVSYYVIGQKLPDYANLLKIAEYFDVSIDYLLRGEYKDIYAVTGLSGEAVENLKAIKAHETTRPVDKQLTQLITQQKKLFADEKFIAMLADVKNLDKHIESTKAFIKANIFQEQSNTNVIDILNDILSNDDFLILLCRLEEWVHGAINFVGDVEKVKPWFNFQMQEFLLGFFSPFLWKLVNNRRAKIEAETEAEFQTLDKLAAEVKSHLASLQSNQE